MKKIYLSIITVIIFSLVSYGISTNTKLIDSKTAQLNIIGCPSDITQNTDPDTCGAIINFTIPTSDDPAHEIVQIDGTGLTSGDFFPLGETTLTFEERVTSTGLPTGNTCSFTVTVEDNAPPTPPSLSPITVDCNGTLTAPTTTDACTGMITGTTTDTLTFVQGGSSIINWTFDDGNGNSISVPQTYNYDDSTAPVPDVSSLADITAECSTTITAPTATDNCEGTITATTTDPLTYNAQGSYTITWTYDDGNGNSSTQTQNVVIDDTTTPDIPTLTDVTGECSATATIPTTTDNCGATISGTTSDPLTYNIQGTYTITWNFDDGNGNDIDVTQNVIVDDTSAPVPDVASLTGITAECSATITAPTATDNCEGTITATTTDPLTYNAQGSYTITWTYDDGNGNSSTQTQNVEIDDVTDPDIPTLADVTGECSATATIPTTTDNCGATISGTTSDPLTYNTQGTYTITWNFDDGNGNDIDVTQNVIVDDISAPVPDVASLADITAECSTTITAPTATDNCEGTITATTTDPLTYNAQGSYTITWTYDDGNGNSSTQTQNVVIDDTTTPDIPTLTDVTGECSATATIPTTTDNCGATISGTTSDPLTYNTQGTYTITWNFDDGNGNDIDVTQNVIVDDTSAPVPDVASLTGITAECSATITAPTATDNCEGTITATTTDPLTYNAQGSYTITWTYDDGNGNSSTQTQNVEIDDVTDPDIPTLPDVTGECSATATIPTTTDNCGATISGTTSDPLTYNTQGTYTITWNFDDGNGNDIDVTQNVIVDDISAPVPDVASLTDITAECSATITAPTATDNCEGTITATTTDPLTYNAQGSYTITWTYDDGNGNSSTQTQNVVIDDTTAPTISCPSNITTTNDSGLCSAVVSYTMPTGSDNCGSITITQISGLSSGSPFPVGTTTNTFEIEDTAGNTTTCSFDVIVNDTENPTITCPSTVTVNANANCEATSVTLGTPTTNDNCSVATVTNNAPSTFPLGNTTVTWTVTDNSGNSAQCTQTVTVIDNTPPSITCPSDIIINTDTGLCTASGVALGTPTVTDNCGAGYSNDAPSIFPIGDTTVTWTATDGNGNTTTCTQLVTVEDNEAPVANCQNFTVALNPATGLATISTSDINNGSTDNCSIASITLSQDTFDCNDIGNNTVTLTVTDASGNTDNCNATVTVTDAAQGASVNISVNNNPICDGEAVTFTATPNNGGSSPNYEWFVNGSSVGNNNSTYTTNTLTNNDQVYVEMTSNASVCATAVASNSITMDVNPTLPVSYTLNASANPACSGDNLTFFITGLVNGGSSPTYQWYLNGTPVGSNTNSYSSSTINDGDIISVDVTSNATCANPVPATESLTMTVNPLPTVTAQANGSNTNITVCEGDTLTLTGSGASTYTWDNGVVNGVPLTPSVGVHTYTVTGTDVNGCENNDSITVTVNPNASITLLSTSADQSVCRTGGNPIGTVENINFNISNASSVSVTGLPAGVNYNYNSTTGNLVINGNPNNGLSGTFDYTITANNSCNTTTTTGTITVYSGIPSTPGSINGPSSFGCPISTAIYYVADDPNVETYNWNVPGSMTITNGQGTNQIEVEITGTVTFFQNITVTASNACGTSTSRSLRVLVSYSSTPISAGPDIYVCEGTPTVIMDGDVGGIQAYEWEWSDSGAGGSFSPVGTYDPDPYCDGLYFWGNCYGTWVDPPPRPLYSETSTYTLPPGAQAGDIITISLISDNVWNPTCDPIVSTMQVYVIESPTATITNPATICGGDDVIITGTPNTTVSYNFNGNPAGTFTIGASGTITFPGLGAGTYTLTSIQYTNAPNSNGVGCVNTLSESVIVNEPISVTAPNDITICEGETVNLSSTTYSGTNAVVTWTTSGSGNFSGNTYSPSAGDIFNGSVTLTVTNTPSDGICPSDSDSMVVTINPLPTVYAGINQTICEGESVTLSSASYGGSATSASWSTAGDGSFSGNVYTPGATDIANGSATLTYTTNNPAGPCGAVSDTVVITINPSATVNAGNDVTICEGETVSLSSASYGGSATSASWSTSGTGSFSAGIYTPSATDITNGSVTLTYTTNNPAGPCGVATDYKLVTINPLPVVDAGTNATICETDGIITLNATLGGSTTATWSSSGDGTFNNNNPNAVYTLGANDLINGNVTLTYTTNSALAPCSDVSDSVTYTIIPYVSATATNLTTISDCTAIIDLQANSTGEWSATSSSGHSFSFSNINDPNATFTGESGGTYDITWTIDNISPCSDSQATISNVTFPDCGSNIDFDGVDDVVSFQNNFNQTSAFSIETWIKPNALSGLQTIYSKRNANNLNTGYDLRLTNSTLSFRWNGGGQISATGLTTNRWYHTAVTFDGTTYKLYVDGIELNSNPGSTPNTNTMRFLLGAMDRNNNTPTNHFNGWLDELRVWDVTLTTAQIREMMNQEIEQNGVNVRGSVLGLDISGLAWSDLNAYYQMNQSSDVNAGVLLANSGSINGSLLNITSLQDETAPLPYISNNNGNWDTINTWLYGNVQQTPNTNGLNNTPINWNIVRTQHNVTSNRNTAVLGLLVDSNRYTIDDDSLLVSRYLKIDGILDLENESQLFQTNNSYVDYSASGYLEIDQQGSSNAFNYNYWGSPVTTGGSTGTLNTSEGKTYRLNQILHDGNSPVNWTNAYNASPTSPVTLSSRWIYSFSEGGENNYPDWIRKGPNVPFNVGLGFTLKGSGAATANQNYSFRGQPNNGSITNNTVTAGPTNTNQTLIGNPYPSAIDANEFIKDNLPGGNPGTSSSIDGALYFWKQSSTNNTHVTVAYQGGYATYSLIGGVPATAHPDIAGVGDASLDIPGRYIPVGQGFFVTSAAQADQISNEVRFHNSQRVFVKETSGSSVFFRDQNSNNQTEDTTDSNAIKRVRLEFISPEGAVRPLLLGFTPDNTATNGFDYGYDAENSDSYPNDMSFDIEGKRYVIQGVGAFNEENIYPVIIDLEASGPIDIALNDLENFEESVDVFVYDALQGTYSRINDANFHINLDAGIYQDRFFITFQEEQTLSVINETHHNIVLNYLQSTDEIYVKTPQNLKTKQVYLVNMLGQTVRSWNSTNAPLGHEFKLPVNNISEGSYIIKVLTTNQITVNKKIVIKQ
ncbi:HYR-like domain-containing protein [Mangrovimonas cancribranchiae]|uniref:HYR domain-containing protein n=1 Tax=Mangrovimonas cancribranchiae TaxID=3080055 RepID=A0AAU6P0R8_9FLAO